jgi:hypothetical protein
MFELDGVLNRAQVSDNTGVVPENLYNSVWNGSMSASLGGRFTGVGGGEINSYSEYGEYAGNGGNGGAAVSISIGDSVYDRGYGGGTTLSIINNETHVAQNWGIYGFELYGEFTNAKPDWTAKVGGSGSFGAYYDGNGGYFANDDGFWLADASGTLDGTGKLTGALANGKFITYTRLGTLGGDLLGSLDAAYNVWEAVSLGTYEGTPLAFVSNIYYSGETGWLEMLLGGTDSLWTGTDIPVMGLGNVNGGSGLASGSLYSYNYKNDTNTTYDSSPGAYRGFYSLAGNANNGVDGSLIALYVDNNGKVGVLGGPLTGHINTNAMLEVNGTLNRFGLGDVPEGLIPANFTSNIGEATTGYSLADSDSSTIGFNFLQEDQAWISSLPQPTWGIWQARMEGASVPDNSIWTSSQSWYWQTTSSSDGSMTRWYNFDAQGDSATGALSGAVAGAAVDWVNAKTAVLGADIKGLFDPTAATWKAISNGTSMETAAFVNLVNTFATDAEKNAFMAAMKIPAINVGQATLTQGVGTVNNLSNVAMNNVTFFATSTGAAPKIWATNDVSGNYAAAPSLTGPSVNLSGNGLNATFNVNYWDGANWGARVAGSGTLSGGSYTGAVEFKGGAAGKIDQPAAGSFSGTGAGVAK